MKRLLISIAVIFFIHTNEYAQSYGLTFSSHEVVQEKRTSLDLSPDDSLCFTTGFELGFDINFLPRHDIYFGYVFRIIAVGNNPGTYQNIDLIYNQRSSSFKVIIGENFSGISFSVDSLKLYKEWNRFGLRYDLEKRVLQFSLNGRTVGTSPVPATGNCFKFLWGANDFQKFRTRDIPPMQIRDIKIAENKVLKYSWPLDETSGDVANDKTSRRTGKIKNPAWIKPKYQKWELIGSFAINGYAGVAYDARRDKLYLSGSDSLAVYGFLNDQNTVNWIPSRHQDLLLGHQGIYDTLTNKLYDVFIDGKTVGSYDFGARQWAGMSAYATLTEFWHANKFISAVDTSLYIVGGYGQLRYKNQVQRYHFATGQWDSVPTSGEYLPPRYLSALGTDPQGKFAYIIGGYGSHTGDQMLDPKNYYDLFRYDIKGRAFKKIYSLKPLSYPFTFANSLVITAKPNTYYGLLFPNDSYNSSLQLIEGSLTDSTFRPVGNAIPYSFHDIQSFADLYYSPLSNKLIAVTLFYSKGEDPVKNTQVRIYTLNFPPEPMDPASITPAAAKERQGFWILSALLLAGLAAFYWVVKTVRQRRRPGLAPPGASPGFLHKTSAGSLLTPAGAFSAGSSTASSLSAGSSPAIPDAPVMSAIYLFGPFQVFDREGHDCTRLFTPLLKELFLIITTYTIRNGRGISSEGLNELLWHDKAEKDAKNNRSVNIAKLKSILEKIGNCVINKESGYWQFQAPGPDTYVDYKRFVSLLQETADPAKAFIHPLVDIIKRGPFLSQTEHNWLDDIKSEISNSVIDHCLGYLRGRPITENPEFIIEITNCIFYFDHLNEDALMFKCKSLILLKRHTLASNTYQKFIKDYKDIYTADFDKTFQEIIA